MKKTLIAVAVGSAFAVPAAYADVTLSGSINAGPAYVHQGTGSSGASNGIVSTDLTGAGTPLTTTGQAGVSSTGLNTNYSNITIGSLEDLGGGLKLDFAYQLTANFQNTSNGATNRNSHIGLVSDSWGGVWYGTNEQLYEQYMYSVDPLDGAAGMGGNLQMLGTPGFGNVFQVGGAGGNPSQCANSNGGTGCSDFYFRESQAIWYNSPNFNGLTFGVYTTLAAYKTPSNPTLGLNSINPGLWGAGAKYVGTSLPIQAWVAYEHHKDNFGLAAVNPAGGYIGSVGGAATSSSDYGVQLGVGYTFGDIFAYVNFEQLKYDSTILTGGDATYKRNAFSVAAKWNIATGYVGGQFIKAMSGSCELPGTGCSANDTGGYMFGLGYYHTLSKQTQAYVMATYIKNDDLQYYTTAGGVGSPLDYGSSIWGVTVGLKHSF